MKIIGLLNADKIMTVSLLFSVTKFSLDGKLMPKLFCFWFML